MSPEIAPSVRSLIILFSLAESIRFAVIRVGDIVRVENREPFPADILCLSSNLPNVNSFSPPPSFLFVVTFHKHTCFFFVGVSLNITEHVLH